jgi:hypothetical protein
MRECKSCGEIKPFSDYPKKKDCRDGIKPTCKVCFNKSRPSRAGCPKAAAYNKEYAKTREYVWCSDRKEYAARRYAEKKEELLAQNRAWREANPDKNRAKEARRRARKLQATPDWLEGTHLAHIKRTYKLATLMEEISGDKYHVDHIVPLQGKNVCGLHVPWNLQVLRADLNLSKSNTLTQEKEL